MKSKPTRNSASRNDRGKKLRAITREQAIAAKTTPIPPSSLHPSRLEAEEAKRLDAEHDPATRSACRLCGIWLGPRGQWTTVAGWKCCPSCRELIDAKLPGRQAIWRHLLEDNEISREESDELSGRFRDVAFFVGRWPTDEGSDSRWEHSHVNGKADLLGSARVVLARRRQQQGFTLSPSLTGCAWCGSRLSSDGWIGPVARWGTGKHFGVRDAFICIQGCGPMFRRSGGVDDGEHMLAVAIGLTRGILGVDLGVVSYLRSRPADSSGTDQAWAYLGPERARLRRAVVVSYPKFADTQERQQMAIEQIAKTLEEARQPRQLSSLG